MIWGYSRTLIPPSHAVAVRAVRHLFIARQHLAVQPFGQCPDLQCTHLAQFEKRAVGFKKVQWLKDSYSLDCFKGKSTGNHCCSYEIWGFPTNVPFIKPIHWHMVEFGDNGCEYNTWWVHNGYIMGVYWVCDGLGLGLKQPKCWLNTL